MGRSGQRELELPPSSTCVAVGGRREMPGADHSSLAGLYQLLFLFKAGFPVTGLSSLGAFLMIVSV